MLQKKVNILEYAFTACVGVYYSVDFSRDYGPVQRQAGGGLRWHDHIGGIPQNYQYD